MYKLGFEIPKGGVGKTTNVVHLARIWAIHGWRVLVVDVDPQANATRALGVIVEQERTLADAIQAMIVDRKNPKVKLADIIVPTHFQPDRRVKKTAQIDVAPSSLSLNDCDLQLGSMPVGRLRVLRRMLDAVSVQYDLCLIDCGWGLSYLVRNAIVAADGLVLPILPEPASFSALADLRGELEKMTEDVENLPALIGSVATRFDVSSNRHEAGVELLRSLDPARSQVDVSALRNQFGSVVDEFDMSRLGGLELPFLGSIANNNSQRSATELRWSYEPVATAIATRIGLNVLSFESAKENSHASI